MYIYIYIYISKKNYYYFGLFPNSGTLKGSSRLFKESQGFPANVPESGQLGSAPSIFGTKTNTFL